jgi:hypothetical protein
MEVASIGQTTERSSLTSTIEKEQKQLSSFDRCDQCGGQAFVLVAGIAGELTFCGHHYTKIEKNDTAYDKLKEFAYEIIDDRHKLEDYEDKRTKES